ncbi:3-oxoacyl-(acyl-carrier-protein) reductase [Clostridium sp. DL-VIII]|uniref:SDR family oxidoreductase n=1 Tax=Clostridium sp. DL-VIII TaxID=641107 RepID=UPI00023AF137|nr:SDR family oxidoreductase [Clostridium sp. DL-VIII]EHI98181.1 3-oxoacyl-(acyl-carrier-protein) reductase [Clostridium sp. DL-VIII]
MDSDYRMKINFDTLPRRFPPQHQNFQPGIEELMNPLPIFDNPDYKGSGKLENKVALITGGDSGIGRAVAIAFAKEGADVAISYLYEHQDALKTKKYVEKYGGTCLLMPGDISHECFCEKLVECTIDKFGKLDILINNAGVQFPQDSIECISPSQLKATYSINIFPMFHLTQAALPYMKRGSTIVNTASVTAYQGPRDLIDYASTKGAIVTFTRSLSNSLVPKGIRVNAIAPGPIWTPLIVSSYSAERVAIFGSDTPMKRAGQPFELAPGYVYLASDDSSYVSGQVLHINGGIMVDS